MEYLLAKITRRQFAEELVANGSVYMKRLEYYVDLESQVLGDKDEGLAHRVSGLNPSLKVTITPEGGEEFELPGVHSIRIHGASRDHAVFCMYRIAVDGPGDSDGINLAKKLRPVLDDRRMVEFGNVLVLFMNSEEFIRRVEEAARREGHEIEHRPIEYVPPDYCGDMGPFRKLNTYEYQQEARIMTTAPIEGEHLILKLGPLFDIVRVVELDQERPGAVDSFLSEVAP